MKMLCILMLAASLQIAARGYSQGISITLKNEPLEKLFTAVEQQTNFSFVYSKEAMELSKPVTIDAKNETLENILKLGFSNQPLTYSIDEKFIIVKIADKKNEVVVLYHDVNGKVINTEGEPIAGVTVTANKSNKATSTNDRGEFTLKAIDDDDILIITSIGFYKEEIQINKQSYLLIKLKIAVGSLDETIVMAYGQTTRRLNTGNISKVTSEEINKQPVSNPLAALEGRVSGLIITQSKGLPGAPFSVQIRGNNSIAQGSSPLFIIDGVPFAPNNNSLSQISSSLTITVGSGISPLDLINPSDIESIEVLKDADATSIYGSRGANGVILITTKKGKPGVTRFTINAYSGFSKLTRAMDLLNTEQYIKMRREAFTNDGITPSNANAYDLLLWDTTRYTDLKNLLIGNTAKINDIQSTVSGGNTNTHFLIGGGFHRETTVFGDDFANTRGSCHLSLGHFSNDRKFNLNFFSNYGFELNNLTKDDLAGSVIITAIPNLPPLYDSVGNLNWSYKGVTFSNPLSYLRRTYNARSNALNSNLQLNYNLFSGLSASANLGYNWNQLNEISTTPIASQNPASNPTGSSVFGNSTVQGWIIEPQLKYNTNIQKGKLQILMGSTFQRNTVRGSVINASGYNNDNLLKNVGSASSISSTNSYTEYKYSALFGRVNYNWLDKYIINLTGRRDGSSRFGPGKQFANFGSAAIAWIFSNSVFARNKLHFLNYGKIRFSYGSSGNDQIGDYQFLSAWRSTNFPYQGSSGLYPNNLFNADYSWEVVRKAEIGIDLTFLKNRILISGSYYRNRSSNELVSYQLPTQTGFSGVTKNFPALVQNSGLEIELSTKNVEKRDFSWTTSINLTIPKNKLVEFPGLATSNYTNLVIDEPLSVYGGFYSLGVDPQTGVYQFLDAHGAATFTPSYPTDYVKNIGNLDPKFYGGLQNILSYRNLSLSLFFEFKKQVGPNFLNYINANFPGTIINQFTKVLDRWQKPGDITNIQKFSQSSGSSAGKAAAIFRSYGNDLKYSDASYIRLRNLSLSYSFREKLLTKFHLQAFKLYVQGQNLITITNYFGSDPENKQAFALPPLKTITGGIQVTF